MGMESDDFHVKSMAIEMNRKFEKYWREYNLLLAIACVLDPRYKIQFVEFCYKRLYGDDSRQFGKVKSKLFSLFNEYASKSEFRMPRTFEDSNKAGSSQGHEDIYDEHCMDVLKVKYFLNVKSFFHLVNFSISHA